MEIEPAADEFNLRVTGNHPPEFIEIITFSNMPIIKRRDATITTLFLMNNESMLPVAGTNVQKMSVAGKCS